MKYEYYLVLISTINTDECLETIIEGPLYSIPKSWELLCLKDNNYTIHRRIER
jgi:hypothetical protein